MVSCEPSSGGGIRDEAPLGSLVELLTTPSLEESAGLTAFSPFPPLLRLWTSPSDNGVCALMLPTAARAGERFTARPCSRSFDMS